jgi:hypothetical protein
LKRPGNSNNTSCVLNATELDRLCKICGLFSSGFSGERANAAAMADRMLRERGLQWCDVLGAAALPKPNPDPAPQHEPEDWLAEFPGGWRAAATLCLRSGTKLSSWERKFCIRLAHYKLRPSSKQVAILKSLVDQIAQAWNAE